MKYLYSFAFTLLLTTQVLAQRVDGVVYDSLTNEALEFVNVFDQDALNGTITNEEGYFNIKAQFPLRLRFSFLGYDPKEITLQNPEEALNLKIYLSSQSLLFPEVVMEGEKTNLGRDIIRKIIKNKKSQDIGRNYSTDVYQQTVMTKFTAASEKDSIPNDTTTVEYLNEMASTQYVEGNKLKKVIQAEIKSTGDKALKRMTPMTMGGDFRGSNQFITYNPLEYFTTPEDFDIDIYDNAVNNSALADRPITSPLSTAAMVNYTYRLKKMDFIESDTLFTIAVRPRFKEAPLWRGTLIVNSDGYKVEKANLDFDPDLNDFKDFSIQLIYSDVNGIQIPTDKRISYKASINSIAYDVKSTYRTSNYNFDLDLPAKFFSSETVRYEESALKPNADLMLSYRGVALEQDLNIFFNEQDSIYRSITSDEYLSEQDSIFNKLTWRKVFLEGFGRRNRSIGLTYGFNPVISLFQPFGVNGFRVMPGGYVDLEFPNSNQIDVNYNLSVGLTNLDFKGQGRIGYTFYPQKFARVYVGAGDIFDFVTFNQSLDALISRSNFITNRFFNMGYSMELINGLYFNSSVSYSDKASVKSLSSNWLSDQLFGDQNTSFDFDRYQIFQFDLDFIIRFGQKYMTRGRKKIVLPDDNPVLTIKYRKGLPGVLNSEVNFDYLEAELTQKLPSTKLGSLNWRIRAGTFLNKRSLRILEYNFFRGSTALIFTNPLNDLVQIGETRATPNAFFQAGAIHHFNGFFLDKVPLINKLQMEMLAGAGSLIIPDQGFFHAELYLGVGKKFKLWGETLQLAVYAVTADSSLSNPLIEYKVGINFYNAFAREWVY